MPLFGVRVLGVLLLVSLSVGACSGGDTERVEDLLAGADGAALTVPVNASESGPPPEPALDTGPEREPRLGPVVEPRGRLVINGVGDVNYDPGYIPALASHGYEHGLDGLDGLFLEDDLTVINLECPATTIGSPVPKQFNFRCDPAALPILADQGVEVANQANNHSLDYGVDAMLDSLANLEANGIASVGTGADISQADRAALFEINGWTVAVLGFGGVIPNGGWLATDERPGMSNGDDVESIVAAVEAADRQADIVVVSIHWGKELQTGPPADDVIRAEAMIDAGADVIFGHHAHRLNALEWYRGRPIAWSLGNFVWPNLSAAGSDTAVAQAIIHPDGRVDACLLDATIVSHGHPRLDDPEIRTCIGPGLGAVSFSDRDQIQ